MPQLRLEQSSTEPTIIYARDSGGWRVLAYLNTDSGEFFAVNFLRKQLGHEQRVALMDALANGERRFNFEILDLTTLPASFRRAKMLKQVGHSLLHLRIAWTHLNAAMAASYGPECHPLSAAEEHLAGALAGLEQARARPPAEEHRHAV